MQLETLKGKAKPAKSNINHPCYVSQDDVTGDTIIRIPQRVSAAAVHASKTEKAVPMVTLVPQYASGKTGSVTMPIVVVEERKLLAKDANGNDVETDQVEEVEAVFNLRMGAFNGFVVG